MENSVDRNRLVVVLGMHRSGTSLLANAVGALGVELGDVLLNGDEWNVSGYWERPEIFQTQDEILRVLGRRWDTLAGVLPLPEEWWQSQEIQSLKQRLLDMTGAAVDDGAGVCGFKDPRTATLLPLWQQVFAELHLEPMYLLAVRHPDAVAASLRRRNRLSHIHAQLLWLKTYLDALGHTKGDIRLIVPYEDWFTAPLEQLQRLSQVLVSTGVDSKVDPASIVEELVRPELLHHQPRAGASCLPYVETVYRMLLAAAPYGDWPTTVWDTVDAAAQMYTALDLWNGAASTASDADAERPAQELHTARRLGAAPAEQLSPEVEMPALPQGEPNRSSRRLRICIVSSEFNGPYRNGGIGTANTSLGVALAAAGHDVTFLFTRGRECENKTIEHWVAHYGEKDITFVPLPQSTGPALSASGHLITAYHVHAWLGSQPDFDVVHFHEMGGFGYYALLAKHQGLAFQNSIFCIGNHSATLWIREANSEYLTQAADLELDFVERESVALADVAWSPSQYLFRWMRSKGWRLPPTCYVQPYILPRAARTHRAAGTGNTVHSVDELVFFGRLETRKGLALFCDALDQLVDQAPREFGVTFLGRHATVYGRSSAEYIAERAQTWPWPWQIISDYDQPEAMAYLQQEGRVAVMPSPVDNSPNTVYECLGAHIPFFACSSGGIPELIAAADVDEVCFPYRASALAEKFHQALSHGTRAARPAIDFDRNEAIWVGWHEHLVAERKSRAVAAGSETAPLVSVCVTHYNRPRYLEQALESIAKQTYRNFEVILVDDGSSDPEALDFLDALESEFARRHWTLIRQGNRYLGAARNAAARAARGDFLLFMDDDNLAKPHQIETFVRAASHSGADILTCFMDRFSGHVPPTQDAVAKERWLFLGGAVACGLSKNLFGDANALVRRDAFWAVGGFSEDYGVTHEDWELFAAAVLKGLRFEVVPEALFWYRVSDDSMINVTDTYRNEMRHLRPYLDAVAPSLRNLVLLAHGQEFNSPEAAVESYDPNVIELKALVMAARVIAGRGDMDGAMDVLRKAMNKAKQLTNPSYFLEVLLNASKLLAELGNDKAAKLILSDAQQLSQALNHTDALQKANTLAATLP